MSGEIDIRFAVDRDTRFLSPNVYIREEVLRRKIEWQEFIVAEKGGESVGFIELEYLWSLVPYMALIKVLPEHREKGIGKRLLEFTEEFLVSKGHKELYSSSQENEAAPQKWHKHVGFSECGKIEGINEGVGEVFFCKSLGENLSE